MPRKSHRKSRLGCRECKRRHLKCDETKPKCINCVTAQIRCPYETERPLSRSQDVTPDNFQDASVSKMTSISGSPTVNSLATPESPSGCGNELNMLHLELLHWWMSGSYKSFLLNSASPELYANTCIKHGLQHRFLMRQILATSALHLSVAHPEKRAVYHQHATQLQAEALAEYNLVLRKLDESNILSAFLFSSLTGIHVFCDTFTSGERDFNLLLDSLVSCINVLRGVRAVIGTWWDYLLNSEIKPILQSASDKRRAGKDHPYRLDEIRTLIAEADIGSSSLDAYQQAIAVLEEVFTIQSVVDEEAEAEASGVSANMVFSWLVSVPKEYVDLLSQRRPEALIIFAYYAVLLHHRRNFWAITDAGEFLINGIGSHLGRHWEKWLLWPQSVMMGLSTADAP